MAQFLFFFQPMDLEALNKEYFIKKDMYDAVLNGISSSLINYSNGIMHIHVVINDKWRKSYNSTAYEVAENWRKSLESLKNAIGCKVYIIDLRARSGYTGSPAKPGKQYHHICRKGILFRKDQLN